MSLIECMKWALCSLPFSSLVTLAAIPPMGPQTLRHLASTVVVGTVERVEHHSVKVPGGTDELFTATLRVEKVEQGLVGAEQPRELVIHFRRTGTRPDGWAGPQGQNTVPAKGEKIRAYCRDEQGRLALLEPNGWEQVR